MENSWQVKFSSTMQSSTPSVPSSSSQELRNQAERNSHCYPHLHDSHDSRQKLLGMVQDPPLTNYPNLTPHKFGQVNLGNSFLALLSGPPSLLQSDFKELPNSKPTSDSNSVVVNNIGNGIPLTFSGLQSEYPSEQNLQHGTYFCPISSRVVDGFNCSSCSFLPGFRSQGPETRAIHCMIPGNENAKGFSLIGELHGIDTSNAWKVSSTKAQTSQMKSLEANSFLFNHSYSFLSDCPRVLCLETGGYLLISNTGLLGIVCSCHSIHMSVLKFCEHSGLYDVNPGDAVRLDNGETIAQWRKLYFQKFQIRVPEDQRDWDWPDGLSATSDLMKSKMTLPSVSSNCSLLVHSSEGLVRSGQLFNNVMLPKNLHADQCYLMDALQNKLKCNVEDSNNINGFFGTSQNNIECLRSTCSTVSGSFGSCQDGHQSVSAYIDSILKNGNSSITGPGLQDVRTMGEKSDFCMFKNASASVFAGKDAAFSNVELKLGQPYQNSKSSERSSLGPQLLDAVVNPSKLRSPEQMIHNNWGNAGVGQSLYFSAGPCPSLGQREQNQLNLGNNALEISKVDNATAVETSRGNLSQNAVASLLTNFNLLAENGGQVKPNDHMTSVIEHTVPGTHYDESCFAKFDQTNVLCNSGNGLERQLNISGIGSHGLITDKGKGGNFVEVGSYFVKDSGSRIPKQIEISPYHPQFSAAQGSSCNIYQLASVLPEAHNARGVSNNAENIRTFGSSLHVDHVNYSSSISPIVHGLITPSQVTKGIPLATYSCLLDQPSTFQREESISVSSHLLDDNLRMLALRQLLELSRHQHTFPSFGIKKGNGRCEGVSYLHHSLAESSARGEQCNGPGHTGSREVFEAAKAHPRCATTSLSGCCDLSSLIRTPIHSKEIALPCQLSSDPIQNEQPSVRYSRSGKNIAGLSELEKWSGVPSTCFQHNCNFSVHKNCLKNLESTVGSFPSALKEQPGMTCGEASVIVPKFCKNHIFQNDQGGSCDGKPLRNSVIHASQWRDVPSKVKEVNNATCGDTSAKHNSGTTQTINSFTEHETSNISSGSYAPGITQLSVDVSNMDCSSADVGDTGCISNLNDEGSGIEKCCSSDVAHGSERSPEFLGDVCKTNLKESASSKNLKNHSTRSLLDELKLIDSMTWRNGRKKFETGITLLNEEMLSNEVNRCLKKGKKKRGRSALLQYKSTRLDNSSEFPSSESFKRTQMLFLSNSEGKSFEACFNQHSSKHKLSKMSSMKKPPRKRDLCNLYNDSRGKVVCWSEQKTAPSNCGTPGASVAKKSKRECTSHNENRTVKTYKSTSEMKSSFILQENVCQWKSRPIVCGKYGQLFNRDLVGEMSKPAKIVPLCRVLKRAKRCKLPKNEKALFASMKELKMTGNDGTDGSCNGFHLLETNKKSRSHKTAVSSKITNDDTSLETMKNGCDNRDNNYAEEFSVLGIETNDRTKKDKEIEDCIPHVQLKPGTKENRKRSIHELTIDEDQRSRNDEDRKHGLCKIDEDWKHGSCKVAETSPQEQTCTSFCCVCGSSNKDEINYLLECSRCLIRVHQGCYGVSRIPKGNWYCRPCRSNSKNIVCVLCGYGGGAMTQALRSRTIVRSLLRVWNVDTECISKNKHFSVKTLQNSLSRLNFSDLTCGGVTTSFPVVRPVNTKPMTSSVCKMDMPYQLDAVQISHRASEFMVDNSITAGLLDSTTKQWIHMVCGLWTPGTRCPNVDTMSAFDVSGVSCLRADMVCSICNRPGGSCIKCRNLNCFVRFHPWCAHEKGLLQSEVEGVDNEKVGFYGRCVLHATHPMCESDCNPGDRVTGSSGSEEVTCARTEGYKGRKRDSFWYKNCYGQVKGMGGCHVPQEQLNAWIHINGQKSCAQGLSKLTISDIEHDCRKEYARYTQSMGWKHLVVYKSGIHALGLYTSRFISRAEMVVEYVGEIVGLRVADKRENEYQFGRKLQYKSACYFFRIDKEHIIDATCRGGIARFVNHSCLPNCVAKVISVRNEKKVVFFAERDIFPGEEITYDYHFNHEDEGKKIPCFCNSKNCRRYLN
ncbi:uncharacterized protein LOC133804082 isoform X3 [Humulus lupulus]|uniref:uncharacterized protein LOC133804082 isoform X3 n=1 Tax=Humulus lupulus TaxID=3486 RepID=UPI002B40424D|nr:uncharacterized protein LOC133804082 isoform X3 [Humulus lupulus]